MMKKMTKCHSLCAPTIPIFPELHLNEIISNALHNNQDKFPIPIINILVSTTSCIGPVSISKISFRGPIKRLCFSYDFRACFILGKFLTHHQHKVLHKTTQCILRLSITKNHVDISPKKLCVRIFQFL